jgi:septal ring factor EnvC (AmiA/AmiB activator)
MTTPEERAERLRALTAELRGSAAEVRKASQETRTKLQAIKQVDVTRTPEFHRLEREAAKSFRSGGSGPVARRLQEKVDREELTWQQIREGTVDPAATRLFQDNLGTLLDEMTKVKLKVEEADAAAEARRRQRDDDEPPTILKKRRGRGREDHS